MPDITINDLIGVIQVIDLASTRGTFRGEELLPVGTLRERLAQYIKSEQKRLESDEAIEEAAE